MTLQAESILSHQKNECGNDFTCRSINWSGIPHPQIYNDVGLHSIEIECARFLSPLFFNEYQLFCYYCCPTDQTDFISYKKLMSNRRNFIPKPVGNSK